MQGRHVYEAFERQARLGEANVQEEVPEPQVECARRPIHSQGDRCV
jgi:hypothetical protein